MIKKQSSQIMNSINLTLGLITAVYITFIYLLPDFLTDDFYIFYLVQKQSDSLFICNPDEKFFLFYRPISYLYFKFLDLLFYNNPLAMKSFNLVVLISSLLLFVGILKHLGYFFNIKVSPKIICMGLLFISLHPDIIQSVLWISNANELLMIFFYLLTILIILAKLNNMPISDFMFVIIPSITYLLSVLAKQQSLHLPMLIGFFLLVGKKQISDRNKKLMFILLCVISLIMIVILYLNIKLFLDVNNENQMLTHLWKKPFALIGLLIYIVFPIIGLEVYSIFLNNKFLLIASTFLSLIVLYSVIKYYRINWSFLWGSLIIVTIIFFPRLIMSAGDRINVLQIYVLLLMLILLCNKFNLRGKIFILVCVAGIASGLIEFAQLKNTSTFTLKINNELVDFVSDKKESILVLAYSHLLSPTSNSYYYYLNNVFGDTSKIANSGIIIRDKLKGFKEFPKVLVSTQGDTVELSVNNDNSYIDIDFRQKRPQILLSKKGARGFSSIRYRLHSCFHDNKFRLIVYTDKGWEYLD